jgi:hypothetical protein
MQRQDNPRNHIFRAGEMENRIDIIRQGNRNCKKKQDVCCTLQSLSDVWVDGKKPGKNRDGKKIFKLRSENSDSEENGFDYE